MCVQDEIVRHEPVFLKTSTSYACKIGHFQYRKLRNGDVYKGRYSRSKKSGDGSYMFMNGDVYEGEFKDDHMEGHGVYTFSGQGRYEGAWSAARYCGHGTETFAKGSTYAGVHLATLPLVPGRPEAACAVCERFSCLQHGG